MPLRMPRGNRRPRERERGPYQLAATTPDGFYNRTCPKERNSIISRKRQLVRLRARPLSLPNPAEILMNFVPSLVAILELARVFATQPRHCHARTTNHRTSPIRHPQQPLLLISQRVSHPVHGEPARAQGLTPVTPFLSRSLPHVSHKASAHLVMKPQTECSRRTLTAPPIYTVTTPCPT